MGSGWNPTLQRLVVFSRKKRKGTKEGVFCFVATILNRCSGDGVEGVSHGKWVDGGPGSTRAGLLRFLRGVGVAPDPPKQGKNSVKVELDPPKRLKVFSREERKRTNEGFVLLS
jgi:hypothetical protein